MLKKLSRKNKILFIIIIIFLLIWGTCCSCTGVLYLFVNNDPYLEKKNPSENGIIVTKPNYEIKLKCDKVEKLYLNQDLLDKTEKEKICSKKGLEVDLKSGRNLFSFKGINTQDNGKETFLIFTIIYDKEKYKENLTEKISNETDKLEKIIKEAQDQGLEIDYAIPEEDVIVEKSVEDLEILHKEIKEKQKEINQVVKGVKSERYQVVKVVDGDTIKIDYKGEIKSVRLIGIDTPETKHPQKQVECFGKEAFQKMKDLVVDKKVKIEFDNTQNRVDKYGRLLLYIWVDDIFINNYMVSNGYAHEYTYNTPYKYQKEFREAQDNAKKEGKGLWGDICACEKKEISRSCSGCEKVSIKHQNWDCSIYIEEVFDSNCTLDCEVKGVSTNSTVSEPDLEETYEDSYICDCDKLCGEMNSCEEAYIQLDDCGCNVRDGDNDGVPCESLCPGG